VQGAVQGVDGTARGTGRRKNKWQFASTTRSDSAGSGYLQERREALCKTRAHNLLRGLELLRDFDN
jgi:hypothetical protein